MPIRRTKTTAPAVIASISAIALLAGATAAPAQDYYQSPPPLPPPGDNYQYPDQGQYQGQYPDQGQYQGQTPDQGQYQGQYPDRYPDQSAPPPGEYAPPPGSDSYDYRYQQYDRDYAGRYSAWAAENCIDRRNNNTAAGAIIGGVLGAVIGSGVAGHHERGEGAVVGGVLGAGAGAAIGSSSSDSRGCPPGYYVRAGAPAFYYGGPAVVVAPSWYNPWAWSGGHWIYHPYREWYYNHPAYWRHRRY
jgi:hypothetical protein